MHLEGHRRKEQNPDPDPFVRGTDSRIRIRTNMSPWFSGFSRCTFFRRTQRMRLPCPLGMSWSWDDRWPVLQQRQQPTRQSAPTTYPAACLHVYNVTNLLVWTKTMQKYKGKFKKTCNRPNSTSFFTRSKVQANFKWLDVSKIEVFYQCCGSGFAIRIRIQESENDLQK